MADDWQVGDYALCVADEHPMFALRSRILVIGRTYTVNRIGRPVANMNNERALGFSDVSPRKPDRGFPETLFVKVTPPPADEFDREVIELLRREPVPSMKDRI